ncbi:CAP domain-containing protein [uncultured Fibrobacter sp.]|uniref:CAP domain-containing protein n=1 Tax=uncultured Fibrobacter sp. TaxID=261512 RepID=UPI0025EF263B|nr:CAP domain-containing protein [uncultured Fibrobacter sp.]
MKINLFKNMVELAICASLAFVISGCSDERHVVSIDVTEVTDEEVTDDEGSSTEKSSSSSSAKSKSKSSSSSAKSSSSSAEKSFFSKTWREDCLAKINEYRATENLDPLTLAPEEKQTCTDQEAADDLAENKAHGHFGNCGEGAQNSGPNFNTSWRKTATEATEAFLKMMWEDEKALVTSGERDPDKKEDYSYIGHYLNMKGNYKTVACGIALTEDGKKGWLNINFFR